MRETRFVDMALIAVALALFAFYSLLFRKLNAAPAFDAITTPMPAAGFQYHLDVCRSSGTKVSVAGWAAEERIKRKTHATTVVVRDEPDGRMYAMKTDLPLRPDVTAHLNLLLGDVTDYNNSGFAASLNLREAGHAIRMGRVYLAYDRGGEYGRYTLIPLPCTFKWLR